MLDLDHPMTEHRFAASALEDFLLGSAQRMTLLPSKERILSLAECRAVLDKLRCLNEEHFQASPSVSAAISEMQEALEQIAYLNSGNIIEDKTDGEGDCAACGNPILRFKGYSSRGLCSYCMKAFMKAHKKSTEGFGTWLI